MTKNFNLILDISKPVNPQNSFEIWRGDSVVFSFLLTNNGETVEFNAGELRVFAKQIQKNGEVNKDAEPLFSGTFNNIGNVAFNSQQTAGDAGNYLLTVIVYDSDSQLITAQGIYFEIKENGYAGYYQPSEDFRDEILSYRNDAISAEQTAVQASSNAQNQATIATTQASNASDSAQSASLSETEARGYSLSASDYATNAQNQATIATQQASNASASAQSAEDSANTAQEILSNVSILSAKTGRFFFNGGTFQATEKQALGTTFSICRTLKIKWEDWETLADYRYFDGNNLGWGSNDSIGWSFGVVSHRLFFYYRPLPQSNGGITTILDLSTAQTQSIMDGNVHTLIVTAENNIFSIYVDGRFIKSKTATGGIINIPTPNYVQTIRQITGEYSRIKQFNFDMSANNAPYTIEDYCTGIEEPPSLHNPSAEYHADYSYADFAMTRNDSTRIVLDNSGNNYHATISGGLAGDKDSAVKTFIDELKTQFTQSTIA